jgi:hypothetical protein
MVTDYNGTGRWSREAIEQRYADYARRFKIASPANIAAHEHEHNGNRWVYPVMSSIIQAIKLNDAAAVEIGVEFIEEDQLFTFGKILKCAAARALRRATLSPVQAERVRQRVVGMLLSGSIPREIEDYVKLLRNTGVGASWSEVETKIDRSDPHLMKYYNYVVRHVLPLEVGR